MVLILGDFSMHICCPSMSGFIADFINCFELFNLKQSFKHPAHDKKHMLDLVLCYGVSLNNTELLDTDVPAQTSHSQSHQIISPWDY